MEGAPRDVLNLLVSGEVIEGSFRLQKGAAYATNQRLLVKNGDDFIDYDYQHISSTTFRRERYWSLIVIGIACFLVGALLLASVLPWVGLFFILVGVLFTVFGVLAELIVSQGHLELAITGRGSPVRLKGSRAELQALQKLTSKKKYGAPIT